MLKKIFLLQYLFFFCFSLHAADITEKREVLKDGSIIIKQYDKKGALIKESPYKNQLKHGLEIEYKNGKPIVESFYEEGFLNGLSRIYYDKYIEERPYRYGKAQGISKISINGTEIAEMVYKDNKTYGLAKFYGEGKNLPYSVFCREGIYISGECEGGRRLSTKEAKDRCENIYLFIKNPPNCEK